MLVLFALLLALNGGPVAYDTGSGGPDHQVVTPAPAPAAVTIDDIGSGGPDHP
jgi:hypothetical protein